jgi:hypothetical protein
MLSLSPFLTVLNQIKVFHWQTSSFSEHKALDSTYDSLSELIDEFIETYMGIYGRPFSPNGSFTFSVDNYEGNNLTSFIDEASSYLKNFNSDPQINNNTDLLNIRDEMLGSLNKLKYLITLK